MPDADRRAVIQLALVDLSGREVTYDFFAPATVVYRSDWDTNSYTLAPDSVLPLRNRLWDDGICSLQPARHVPTGPSKQRIVLVVDKDASRCWLDLPAEAWSEGTPAGRLLDSVRAVLEPVREQCPDCRQP